MNSEISKKFSAWGRVRLDPAPPPISHLQEAKFEQRDPGDHLPAKASLSALLLCPPLWMVPKPEGKKGGKDPSLQASVRHRKKLRSWRSRDCSTEPGPGPAQRNHLQGEGEEDPRTLGVSGQLQPQAGAFSKSLPCRAARKQASVWLLSLRRPPGYPRPA